MCCFSEYKCNTPSGMGDTRGEIQGERKGYKREQGIQGERKGSEEEQGIQGERKKYRGRGRDKEKRKKYGKRKRYGERKEGYRGRGWSIGEWDCREYK